MARRTVHAALSRWWQNGDLYALHNDLREHLRLAEGRQAEPSAGIIDSQSVRAAETVAASSRGYDAAKSVQGTKRHVIVDTLGLLLVVIFTAASDVPRVRALPPRRGHLECRIMEIWRPRSSWWS
ncbi:transposase [Microtetraspora malaysiensis]|uniref:transposase n=1 Tax=Microtetraspora malaysiensis TaxID=161358 RepID=UPI003D90ED8B